MFVSASLSMDSDHSENGEPEDVMDEDVDDWVDEDDIAPDCLCPFCTDQFPTAVATFLHCREKHDFDIVRMSERHLLDCISFIKLINYIRSTVSSVSYNIFIVIL